MFQNNPETKSFFSRFDLSSGSQDLLNHGGNIFGAIGEATKSLDSLNKLQDLHTNKLKVTQDHMKFLSVAIQEILTAHFGGEFNQAAWEKFLTEVGAILTSS